MLPLTVKAQTMLEDFARRTAERLRDESGQTAAEYVGIMVLVGTIIAAIVALGIPDKLAGALGDAVDSITGG